MVRSGIKAREDLPGTVRDLNIGQVVLLNGPSLRAMFHLCAD
jgi:hypothetical protein